MKICGEKTDLGFLKCVVTDADIRELSQRVFNKHRIWSNKLSCYKGVTITLPQIHLPAREITDL